MQTLQEIHTALSGALASEVLLGVINTRVALRTGIDLRRIDANDNVNPLCVEKVTDALTALGFSMQSLQSVAAKNASKL